MSSTSLRSLESDFQHYLLHGARDIEQHVIGTARVPIATRLGIYGNAYRARLIETLEAHYPALLALLGADDFASLGAAYVYAHDSNFASIRYYGAQLGAFLAAHADYADIPVLAELARWEWAMTEVFDASDAASIQVGALAQILPQQWAQLRFDLHPSLRRLDLNWNAPAMWKELTSAREPPVARAQVAVVHWLLWRAELQIFFRPLPPEEAQALAAVLAGESFGDICVALCASAGEAQAPARAAALLREWVESGMIIGTRVREE